MLYLIEILHQTTTRRNVKRSSRCCILSKFYIKPQLCHGACYYTAVVSYRNSTSNHNCADRISSFLRLYLIEILHQTTTLRSTRGTDARCILSKFYIKPQQRHQSHCDKDRCILSKFYIKPQPMDDKEYLRNVVSYRNSTSNHNFSAPAIGSVFVVSYRNSTSNHNRSRVRLHSVAVVSYRNSTSNHNTICRKAVAARLYLIEILHQTTTRASY